MRPAITFLNIQLSNSRAARTVDPGHRMYHTGRNRRYRRLSGYLPPDHAKRHNKYTKHPRNKKYPVYDLGFFFFLGSQIHVRTLSFPVLSDSFRCFLSF